VKGKARWVLIAAVLILGIGLMGSALWGDEVGSPAAGGGTQTVVAEADAAAQPAQTAPSVTTAPPETGKVPTTEVTVTAQKEKPATGTAAEGYRVEDTYTTGPWGEMKLQDTPYSISVVSAEQIENMQISTPDQLFRIDPLTQSWKQQTFNNWAGVYIRGFNVTTAAQDGIRDSTNYGIFLEDKERVEILTGLSGFLYGPANVGGLVNYVTKRPTDYSLADVTVGDYGGQNYYVHGDFGGKIDKAGVFTYRLNVLGQDGQTFIDNQNLRKDLFSGALDWHVASNVLLEFNASHSDYDLEGMPTQWRFVAPGVVQTHFPVPDADKLWSEPWTYNKTTTNMGGVRGQWDINDIFTLRTAYLYNTTEWENRSTWNYVQLNGTYTQRFNAWAPENDTNQGGYLFLDSKFHTGPVEHKITAGVNLDDFARYAPADQHAAGFLSGGSAFGNLSFPVYVPVPFYVNGNDPRDLVSRAIDDNYIIGDDIKFTESWSLLAGLNYADIIQKGYNPNGTEILSQAYDKSAATPTVSLIYKPIPWISTYASYMESLEQGTIVPITGGFTNAGQELPPNKSKQYEVGAKATVGKVLLTAALFQIDKANQYSINNPDGSLTAVQDGREIHKGMEFTATGKATDNLTLVGGFTLLQARITRSDVPGMDGKVPTGVAEQTAKLIAEYNIPRVPGLTLTGGVFYTGAFWGGDAAPAQDLVKLPPVFTEDIGARYETMVVHTPLIFRLNISNLTNKNYWISGGYTGEGFVGDPRIVKLSAEMKF
jgi:iron complex outermembrane receptor protein